MDKNEKKNITAPIIKKSNRPLEEETNKQGQRQGGIDKHGEKEKDKKGAF